MGDRCTGHCCKHFPIPIPLEDMKARPEFYTDGPFIVDMLIPLGKGEDYGFGDDYYTCKHLDTESGNCNAYDSRPGMCRDFPYGFRCNHDECTWDAAKANPTWTREDAPEVPRSRHLHVVR